MYTYYGSDYTSSHHPTSRPKLSKKQQWDILHYYLETAPISELRLLDPIWPASLDRNVLLTALAKKRSKLDLLHGESQQCSLSTEKPTGIDFSGSKHGLGLRGTNDPPPPPQSTSTLRTINNDPQTGHRHLESIDTSTYPISNSPHTRSSRSINHRLPLREQPASPLPNPPSASPISPTFGPRRFHAFSGTVSRRRSLPQKSAPVPAVPAPAGPTHAAAPFGGFVANVNNWGGEDVSVFEKRILWEAAWREVEENLEAYVDKFDVLGVGRDLDAKDNEDVWEELVRLKGEEEKVRGEREGWVRDGETPEDLRNRA